MLLKWQLLSWSDSANIRTCLHKSIRKSFRQILPLTTLKSHAGDSPLADFCLVIDKIVLENPHIYLMNTGSNIGQGDFVPKAADLIFGLSGGAILHRTFGAENLRLAHTLIYGG